jgi:FlgD Ig-like domain
LQRVLSTTALLGLLIATAAAFAITERLKLVKSPVYGTIVTKTLSPVCGCQHDKATVSVRLRKGDTVTLTIRDRSGNVVDTLADGVYEARGRHTWTWDGTDELGARAADGVYRPEIHLAREHRTILLPNPIALDTRAPRVKSISVSRAAFSPDGDKAGDVVVLHYAFDSPAHVLVYLGSQRVLRGRSHKAEGHVVLGAAALGSPLPAGTYLLWVGGEDQAGNITPPAKRHPLILQVRYIALPPSPIVVHRAGTAFTVAVDTDAKHYWWKFAGRHGVASGPVLKLTAPKHAGTFGLAVGERTYTARASVVVGRAK